jgi:hypothetical protein
MDGELPKAEAPKSIVTIDSGGRVSGDLTLWKDFTSEVCICEYFGIRRSAESEVNQESLMFCGRVV